ncbi:ATP-dependent protease La (LON) substrate-binding domain [Fragilaria crotonensis]|nr:ATP-dependent protease La (LON) substrate-binding domain [Fragilaria crotonensis]
MFSSSINPNDLETPEEREERMRLVRKIQDSFYRGDSEGLVVPSSDDTTVLENVPLWRVQWTELPGYQNVLNCHVPHYTHMFRRILSGEKPWMFGHVYLPGGSENLSNPDFRLPDDVNGSAESEATLIGTLMRISDYEQLEDGRLVLIVQALDRFRILFATQHVPFAIATIQLEPDIELMECLRSEGSNELDARMAAVQQANLLRDWEFRPTRLELTSSGSAMGGVSPLVNYDADFSWPTHSESSDREEIALLPLSPKLLSDGPESIPSMHLLQLEHKVWVALDRMLRLLTQINPNLIIPVPSQMLGLLSLPSEAGREWPMGFRLEEYVERLISSNASIGTGTKSPLVRVSSRRQYPRLRRVQRLSYVVWVLFDSIGDSPSKQVLLEETSMARRLELAIQKLDGVNESLQGVLSQK